MNKSKSICFFGILATVLFLTPKMHAFEFSGGAACRNPDSRPDGRRYRNMIDTCYNSRLNFYKELGNLKESQYTSNNNRYIDNGDIHYHVGHGGDAWDWGYWKTLRSVIFEDSYMTPSEAKRIWGNKDLEWIGFRCCQLLNNKSRAYWHKSFDHLHLMCGFKTNSYRRDRFGERWAYEMKRRKTVTQAWFTALDKTNQRDVVARVLAEVRNNYNDHLWGYGYVSSDPSYNSTYWYWDHKSGTPDYIQITYQPTMTVKQAFAHTIDPAYLDGLSNVFGLSGTFEETDESYYLVDSSEPNKTLEIYKASGMYYYCDMAKAWNPDWVTSADPNLGSAEAYDYAEIFLNTDPAVLYQVGKGSWTRENSELAEMEESSNIPLQIYGMQSVVYARETEVNPGVSCTVTGPGARLKVYLDENGDVICAMGNWRITNDNGSVIAVPEETAWGWFQTYGYDVCVVPPQSEYEVITKTSATQGYYEAAGMNTMDELTPVWIFKTQFQNPADPNDPDQLPYISTGAVYVPVDSTYIPPVVEIISPSDLEEYNVGDTITFAGAQTGGFGQGPYTYAWESDIDGELSTSDSFSMSSLTPSCDDEQVSYHRITLTITDSAGKEGRKTVRVAVIGDCENDTNLELVSDLNNDDVVNLSDLRILSEEWLLQN